MTATHKMVNGKIIPLTAGELAVQSPTPSPAKQARAWVLVKNRARAELSETDYWIIKAAETGTPVNADRLAYRAAVRALAAAETGDPSQPFPARPA